MAFLFAILLNMFLLFEFATKIKLKKFLIVIAALCFIRIYFNNGCVLNFVSTIDFGIWILFVVIFDIAISAIIKIAIERFAIKKDNK